MLKPIAAIVLASIVNMSFASKETEYLDEGNLLVKQLIDVLIQGDVCKSPVDCRRNGGFAFFKPERNGVSITVYGVQSKEVAAKLLQTCVTAFAVRPLGTEMSSEIFSVPHAEYIKQQTFRKTSPTFILKLEKSNGNR